VLPAALARSLQQATAQAPNSATDALLAVIDPKGTVMAAVPVIGGTEVKVLQQLLAAVPVYPQRLQAALRSVKYAEAHSDRNVVYQVLRCITHLQ
jgi:hypothetical protein